jgi:DNA repair exonuclease SbcCD nuclease subunit
VRVVTIRGNHDAASKVSRHLKLPDNVRELDHRRPETIVFDEWAVAVHGQSYPARAVSDDLAFGYPDPVPGALNLALLHTSVDGREGHEPYAPCNLSTLTQKGYDYWALGHVHEREVLSTEPWVVFSGNPQGRHVRETGPKGVSLISVDGGVIRAVEHRAVDVVRWTHCNVDVTEAQSVDDALDLCREALARAVEAADGRVVAARVELTGATRAHGDLRCEEDGVVENVRALASDVAEDALWVEKVLLRTEPKNRMENLGERDDAVGQLVRAIREIAAHDERRMELLEELSELKKKLPPELRSSEEGFSLDDPRVLGSVLRDVEAMLLPRLLRGGSS